MAFYDDIVSDQVAPPWLQQGAFGQGPGVGGRYLQTIGIELDAIKTRIEQAAYVSLPGLGDPTGLPLIGNDRLMLQGAAESNTAFATRLSAAFDAWRVGGSDWGVLWQILSLFVGNSGGTPPGRIVDDSAYWSFYPVAATLTTPPLHGRTRVSNWNWDGDQEWTGLAPGQVPWYRLWVIIDSFAPTAWTTTEGNWGDAGNWGDGTASWGLSALPSLFTNIRTLLRSWQSASSWSRWIVVNLQSGNYLPDAANATPDGTWGKWSKLVSSVWVQARDTTARYADGIATGT